MSGVVALLRYVDSSVAILPPLRRRALLEDDPQRASLDDAPELQVLEGISRAKKSEMRDFGLLSDRLEILNGLQCRIFCA